jgi:nucleoside-diphosphate-sugar epimerase
MKKLLITGGLGFLGSYSIEKYKKDWDITVIDNLSTNTINSDDPICDGVKVIIEDVLDYKWNEPFDMILHLASPVGPAGILKFAGKMGGYIIDDIYWAIEGSLKFKAPLIYVSTSEIYGYRSKPDLLKEDDDKILVGDFKVRNEYSMAKLLGEIILSNTAKVTDLQYQIIRPFNISGARQLPTCGFVLPTFINQALDNKPITVFGNGKQIRAFTHVTDIVDGIYRTSVATGSNMNQIWNVGEPSNATTILHLAERAKKLTNSNSEIVFVDPKTIHGPLYEEAWDKIPNSTKIGKLLGWQSHWQVEGIIINTMNYWVDKRK